MVVLFFAMAREYILFFPSDSWMSDDRNNDDLSSSDVKYELLKYGDRMLKKLPNGAILVSCLVK